MKGEQKSPESGSKGNRSKVRPEDVWITLGSFGVQGRCVLSRGGKPFSVVAEWDMPAKAAPKVLGMLLRQTLECYWRVFVHNARLALRWLFWQA